MIGRKKLSFYKTKRNGLIVCVTSGESFDVAANLRLSSVTHEKSFEEIPSIENITQSVLQELLE